MEVAKSSCAWSSRVCSRNSLLEEMTCAGETNSQERREERWRGLETNLLQLKHYERAKPLAAAQRMQPNRQTTAARASATSEPRCKRSATGLASESHQSVSLTQSGLRSSWQRNAMNSLLAYTQHTTRTERADRRHASRRGTPIPKAKHSARSRQLMKTTIAPARPCSA